MKKLIIFTLLSLHTTIVAENAIVKQAFAAESTPKHLEPIFFLESDSSKDIDRISYFSTAELDKSRRETFSKIDLSAISIPTNIQITIEEEDDDIIREEQNLTYSNLESEFKQRPTILVDEKYTANILNLESKDRLKLQQKISPIINPNTIIIAQTSEKPIPLAWSKADFSTPRSPAAKIINGSNEVGSVSTPDELAVQLLTGLNSDGKFQPGIAIDFAPYLLIKGTNFTLAEYRNDAFQRFLARTKLSVATSSSDTNTRLGFGAEFILVDNGDPSIDEVLLTKIDGIIQQPPRPPKNPNESDTDYEKRVEELNNKFDQDLKPKIEAVINGERDRLTQQSFWNIGIGTSSISTSGKPFNLRSDGMGFWTTYKVGMGGKSELILHGNYRSGENISDRKGSFFNGDTVTLATRIRTGDEDFKFSLETAYNIESQVGKESNTYFNFGVAVEPKITKDLWLSFSIDGSTGRQNGEDVRIFSGLKWNFNNGK
jgi:hypothetical protein